LSGGRGILWLGVYFWVVYRCMHAVIAWCICHVIRCMGSWQVRSGVVSGWLGRYWGDIGG
jgi:hypothetical protein